MGKDDHIESFGYPPKKDEKKGEKVAVAQKPAVPKQRPNVKKLLYFPMALGTAGLAYSIYFIVTFLTFGTVESYFPWEWQITYTNFSMVSVIFAVSIGISLGMLVPSSIQFDKTKTTIVESTAPSQTETVVPEEPTSPEDNLDILTIDDLARDLNESKATARELKTHISKVEIVLEKKIDDLGLGRKSQKQDTKNAKEPVAKVEKIESPNVVKGSTPDKVPKKSALERRLEKRAGRNKLTEDLQSASDDHEKIAEQQMEPPNS